MEGKMCLNPSCSAPELISLVPYEPEINRGIISEPHILKEPLLVNGYTSVFNVTGKIDNPESNINLNKTQIKYQVLQNTHVHVTNTVIIDTEKDILRKIEENDPSTLKKLLDSQRMSAAKRLNTFIDSVSKTVKSARKSTAKSNLNLSLNDPKPLLSAHKKLKITSSVSNAGNLPPKIQFIPAKTSIIPPQVANGSLVNSTTHPTLKITSVTSMNEASTPTSQTIQPVAIQAAPGPVVRQIPLTQNSSPLPLISSVQTVQSVQQPVIRSPMFTDQEKSEFQKMREEITELKELLKQIGGNVRRQD